MIVQLYVYNDECPRLVDFGEQAPEPLLASCVRDLAITSGAVAKDMWPVIIEWLKLRGCFILDSEILRLADYYGSIEQVIAQPESSAVIESAITAQEEKPTMLKKLFDSGNLLVDLNVTRWSGQVQLTEEDLRKAGVLKDGRQVASTGPTQAGEAPPVLEQEAIPDALVKLGWKRLIPKDERHRLGLTPSRARAFLDSWALPFPISGVRFIPAKNVEIVLSTLEQYRIQDQQIVDEFLSRYDQIRTGTIERYPEFREALEGAYPPIQEVRAKFSFKHRCFVVDEADTAASANIGNDTEAWFADLVSLLRNEVLTVVKRVTEKMAKGDPLGKPTLESLTRVFEQFIRRDLCQDDTVREAIVQAQHILMSTDAESYKADQTEPRQILFEALDGIVQASRRPAQEAVDAYKRRLMV